jgi:uncharacterized protein (DUF1778 family)
VDTLTKTRRFEARLDLETEELLSRAANTAGLKLTPFVIGAARKEAERVLALGDVVQFSAEKFDEMIDALARPARISPGLAAIAGMPPIYEKLS